MAFKTVGQYDDDPIYSGVFNFGDVMNKSLTEKFDERIEWVRGMDRAKRIETAQLCLLFIAKTVEEVITDGDEFANWLFTFMACVNELACAGLEPVSFSKKQELAEMQGVFGGEDAFINNDIFFDWKQFRDKDHQMLVHSFLGICKDPGLHQYPDCVANYMLVACCADRPNENGIKAARYVWTEYLDYIRRVGRDPDYEYNGTYNRSHFSSSAGRKQETAAPKPAAKPVREQTEEEKKAALLKQEEAKKKAEEEKQAREKLKEEQAKAKAEWRQSLGKIVKQRLETIEELAQKERDQRKEATLNTLAQQEKETMRKLQERIDAYAKSKKDAEQELSTLKFYQFGRKKELQQTMEQMSANLAAVEKEKSVKEAEFRQSKKEAEAMQPIYLERNRVLAYSQNPIPQRPSVLPSPRLERQGSKNGPLSVEMLLESLEKLGMSTKEELEKVCGVYDVSRELDVLKNCDMIAEFMTKNVCCYLPLSDRALGDPKCKNVKSPDDVKKEMEAFNEQRVLQAICELGGYCLISDIANHLGEDVTGAWVSGILRKLTEEGRVTRTEERRRAYFSL